MTINKNTDYKRTWGCRQLTLQQCHNQCLSNNYFCLGVQIILKTSVFYKTLDFKNKTEMQLYGIYI